MELAVRSCGEGIPFVWGHSLMGSMLVEDRAALWDWGSIEPYAEVVRYDARGHGNSDGSYNLEDYCWDQMAADMLAVADSFANSSRARRCLLGGISMGAATALHAAILQPEQVAGLVLVLPPTVWETRPRQSTVYRRMAWISGLFGAAPYRLLDLLPIPIRADGRSRLALHTMTGLAQANPLHVQAAFGGAAQSDMPDPGLLRQLQIPTLILAWEDDTAHPVSTAVELCNTLPDVRGLIVCHPDDIGKWQPALLKFVNQVTVKPAAGRPPAGRKAATKKRNRKAMGSGLPRRICFYRCII